MDKRKAPVSIDKAKCRPCSGLVCVGVCPQGILEEGTDKRHPWSGLRIQKAGNVIPGYADQTVITWDHEENADGIKYVPLWKWLIQKPGVTTKKKPFF